MVSFSLLVFTHSSVGVLDPAKLVLKLIARFTEATSSFSKVNEAQTGQQRLLSLGLAPFLSLSAPGSRDDTPTEQDKGGVECKQVKGAAGLSSMEQEPLGNPLNATEELKRHYWSHHSIDPISPQTLELISLVFGGIRPPLPCSSSALVYSRLLSAMCSRLAVCPDRPPSSSSSSPAVCCWNSSFDRSPELEDFSSFWMSLLGSASVSSRRQHQHVDSLNLFSLMISITTPVRRGSH